MIFIYSAQFQRDFSVRSCEHRRYAPVRPFSILTAKAGSGGIMQKSTRREIKGQKNREDGDEGRNIRS